MGLNLELTDGRTLERTGVKRVETMIQRINAITHSISLQPEIGADGTLHSPLLIVFYEPSGKPNKFEKELAEFTNLYCRSSNSGKV